MYPNSVDADDDFLGDSDKTWDEGFYVKCYYTKNVNQDRKDKFGIADDVTLVVYVSPIDLKNATGSYSFPDSILKKSRGMRIQFEDEYYIPLLVIEKEKFKVSGEKIAIAIEIRLKKVY